MSSLRFRIKLPGSVCRYLSSSRNKGKGSTWANSTAVLHSGTSVLKNNVHSWQRKYQRKKAPANSGSLQCSDLRLCSQGFDFPIRPSFIVRVPCKGILENGREVSKARISHFKRSAGVNGREDWKLQRERNHQETVWQVASLAGEREVDPRQGCPAQSRRATWALAPDDNAPPLKVDWTESMPSVHCRMNFSPAVPYSIKVTCLRHTHVPVLTHTLWITDYWLSTENAVIKTENLLSWAQMKSEAFKNCDACFFL